MVLGESDFRFRARSGLRLGYFLYRWGIMDPTVYPPSTMTTFTKAELPSGIVTVEQLAIWVNTVLVSVNGNKAVVEAQNTVPELVAQYNVYQTPNDGLRQLVRVNVPMDPAVFVDNTKKYWLHAKEMTVGSIPTIYTTN